MVVGRSIFNVLSIGSLAAKSWAAYPNIIGNADEVRWQQYRRDDACSASGIIMIRQTTSAPLKEIIFIFKIMVESVSTPIFNDAVTKYP